MPRVRQGRAESGLYLGRGTCLLEKSAPGSPELVNCDHADLAREGGAWEQGAEGTSSSWGRQAPSWEPGQHAEPFLPSS